MLKQIEIDLEVYKAIEARRVSFDEKPNSILRRFFEIDTAKAHTGFVAGEPRSRSSRNRGKYHLQLLSKEIGCTSLKDVLKKALLTIEEQQTGFLEKLANHRTTRGRRIVARKAEELYPGKPQLVENCAERLDTRWWYDTNISLKQTNRYLVTLAAVAGLKEPPTVKLD